ncbi:MAG: hypothetical protein ACYDD6_10150 [Acidimicrobiales bacterium]
MGAVAERPAPQAVVTASNTNDAGIFQRMPESQASTASFYPHRSSPRLRIGFRCGAHEENIERMFKSRLKGLINVTPPTA